MKGGATVAQLVERLSAAKSSAQQVLEAWPDEAYGSALLEQAIGLIGRCEGELEELDA